MKSPGAQETLGRDPIGKCWREGERRVLAQWCPNSLGGGSSTPALESTVEGRRNEKLADSRSRTVGSGAAVAELMGGQSGAAVPELLGGRSGMTALDSATEGRPNRGTGL
jgi:hypothetical protein